MLSRKISIFFVLTQLVAVCSKAQVTTFQWVQQPVSLSCIASDGRGNCYAAGPNGFIERYSPSGVVAWSENIADLNRSGSRAIALGPNGEIYLAGYVYDTAHPPDPPGSWVNRMFLARLDNSGGVRWIIHSLNTNNASANAIVVSKSGNSVYLVGTESDTIVFGGLGLGPSYSNSILVEKIDQNGHGEWVRKTYSQRKFYNMSNGFSVALDDAENVYAGGQFADTLNFMGIHDSSSGTSEAIIFSVDSGGKARWVKNFGTNGSITGMFFANGFLYAAGGSSLVFRIRPDGVIDKSIQNSGSPITSQGIASDMTGGILLTGAFNGSLSVSPVKIAEFSAKLYLLKLDTGLRPLWASYIQGTVSNPAIASDSLGHHYLYGFTTNGNVRMGSTYIQGTLGFLSQINEWSIICPLSDQSPLCSGDTINIPVHEMGAFANVNTFTAEISDSLGHFTKSKMIGALTASKLSSIRAVIPTSLSSGTKYRIRITTSVPAVVGVDNGYDLTVRAGPAASVFPSGPINICEGDSVTLTASGGESYLWSTGDTTSQIQVGASGDYSFFATAGDGCGILLPATHVNVELLPPVPPITRSGNTLFGNLNGYDNQWYLDHTPIPGADGTTLDITYNGTYDLRVSNNYNCSSTSDDFVVDDLAPSSVSQTNNISPDLRVTPNPASEIVIATLSLQSPERIDFSVLDITGLEVIKSKGLALPSGASSIPIDIMRLSSGIYFVRIQTKEAVETRRLVIER